MAQVRLGLDTATGHAVAVKYLCQELATDPAARTLLATEARMTATLEHPGIVRVLDWGEEEDPLTGVPEPYLVMEYVPGCSMSSMLQHAETVSPTTALRLIASLLQVLSYCHDAGVVHGDIKPANVMVLPTGKVTLLDFGVARAVDHPAADVATGTSYLTIKYASPEQLQQRDADGRSDLYSVGCVLYELLAGCPPFVGHPDQLLAQHLYDKPAPPSSYNPDVSSDVDAVVLRALRKNPDDRYPSATAMIDDVDAALQRQRVVAVAPVRSAVPALEGPNWPLAMVLERARRARHRRLVRAGSLVAAAMLPIAGFGALSMRGAGDVGADYAAAFNPGAPDRAAARAQPTGPGADDPASDGSVGGAAVRARPAALMLVRDAGPAGAPRVRATPADTSAERARSLDAGHAGDPGRDSETRTRREPVEPTSEKPKAVKPTSEKPKPVKPKPVKPKPDEPKPDAPKPVEPKPVKPKPDEPKPVKPKPVEPKPDKPKPDKPKPDKPKPDKPKPDKPKPDKPKPDKPKPDKPKPDKPKPDDPA